MTPEGRSAACYHAPMDEPRVLAVGTAVPARRFDQATVVDIFGYRDALRRRFFLNSGIDGRHLHVTTSDPRPDVVPNLRTDRQPLS